MPKLKFVYVTTLEKKVSKCRKERGKRGMGEKEGEREGQANFLGSKLRATGVARGRSAHLIATKLI